MSVPLVGVLAMQGAFAAHSAVLRRLGSPVVEVRTESQLMSVDALVVPGGESTVMAMLLERSRLLDPMRQRIGEGLPVLGTCAGMILLAAEIIDGRDDQTAMGAVDITVRRNAYGTQVDSFEIGIHIVGMDSPFHGVFIRAPAVERTGPSVDVLARLDGRPVLCRSGAVTVASFHPELSGDVRVHDRFLAEI